MKSNIEKIVIIGAGPTGLALAVQLLRRSDLDVDVTVVEKESRAGGLTASFECEEMSFDYGSHRLHPAASEDIMHDIQQLLGRDLLKRKRNGRIWLFGRYAKFPLRPLDLARNLPLSFLANCARDTAVKWLRRKRGERRSFADVLLHGLGPTMCNSFYFPYARKLWGLDPEKISAVQAYRRVSAKSAGKLLHKVFAFMTGFERREIGRFFYPREGFGQLSEALAMEVERMGGELRLATTVEEIQCHNGRATSIVLNTQGSNAGKATSSKEVMPAGFVFSTVPLPDLVTLIRPRVPANVDEACHKLRYRAMVLFYVMLKKPRFTIYDAHYFPSEDVLFSRVSEPKNYSDSREPAALTGLCAEIPCAMDDGIWSASSGEIAGRVISDLHKVELPVHYPIHTTFVRRIQQAYPVYDLAFEDRFSTVDEFLSNQIGGLVTLGRQGLFVHDNTHHALEMAYRASECLRNDLTWNTKRWGLHRKEFEKHVVED